MKRSLAFFYVLGLFVLGILIGALGMHLYDARQLHAQRGGMPPPGIGRGGLPPDAGDRFGFSERMKRELELTPDQVERIESITREAHREGAAIREEMAPRVHELMDDTRRRIADVLTDEQRGRFEEMTERHRARAERFFLGRGHPERGDGRRPGPPRRRP